MDATLKATTIALQHVLCEEQRFDEELYLLLFRRFAEEMLEREGNGDSPQTHDSAFAWIRTRFITESYKDADSEEAFGLGAFWGAVGVRDACLDVLDDKKKDFERKAATSRHRMLFDIISRTPGITHAKLAQAYGKSPSRLTQIMSEFDSLSLIVTIKSGKAKRYYLSERASRIIARSAYPDNRSTMQFNEVAAYGRLSSIFASNAATISESKYAPKPCAVPSSIDTIPISSSSDNMIRRQAVSDRLPLTADSPINVIAH